MLKRVFVLSIALSIVVVGILLLQTNLPPQSNAYDPASYGLPPTIAGYKTLAVLTADNTACMMPGEKRLVLQAEQATVQGFLTENNLADIQQDLQQRGLAAFAQSNVQIVGPGTTLEQFLSENEKWNKEKREQGCVTSVPAGR